MPHPSPQRLAALMAEVQSQWQQPSRHLVEDAEVSLIKGFWDVTVEPVEGLQKGFEGMRAHQATFERLLPVVRDIHLWTFDRTAYVPLPMLCDRLGITAEEASRQLFSRLDQQVLEMVVNRRQNHCPLCDRRR